MNGHSMSVWLAWGGEYEDVRVDGVYSSKERAIEGIKAQYPPPYKIRWEIDDTGYLVGDFYEFVMDTQAQHVERWSFVEYAVDED